MYISKDRERLYLDSWNYNAAVILSKLAEIVGNNGGRVKPLKTAVITNRTIEENIRKYQERKVLFEKVIAEGRGNGETEKALAATVEKLDHLNGINNDPVTITHTSYIEFVLDNMRYYYQVDSNPFFPFYYTKTPLHGDKYSKDAALEEDAKEWFYDCFLYAGCAKADIIEAAHLIFNTLYNAKVTPIMRDFKTISVPNSYDGAYHKEKVYSPERIGTLDF